jgi:hypothetical protein
MTAISGDVAAADNLETMLDGSGGGALSLGAFNVIAPVTATAVTITGGQAVGGSPAGFAINAQGGFASTTAGGMARQAIRLAGGAGATATNAAKEALLATGGADNGAGGADGAVFTDTGTGVDIRGDLTGNVTGNLSGSVGSVVSFGTLVADVAAAVWAAAARTLTSFGTLVADVKAAILSDNTSFPGADIPAIRAKTDNLPPDPADASDVAASFAATAATLALIKAATDNLPSAVKKNTARRIQFYMISSVDFVSGVSGVVVTAQRALDAGALAAAAGAITDTGSDGLYFIDAAAGDLNGDAVAWLMTAAGCVPTRFTILTEP